MLLETSMTIISVELVRFSVYVSFVGEFSLVCLNFEVMHRHPVRYQGGSFLFNFYVLSLQNDFLMILKTKNYN